MPKIVTTHQRQYVNYRKHVGDGRGDQLTFLDWLSPFHDWERLLYFSPPDITVVILDLTFFESSEDAGVSYSHLFSVLAHRNARVYTGYTEQGDSVARGWAAKAEEMRAISETGVG